MSSESDQATVILFTAPGCPHCPGIHRQLVQLHEQGLIGQLQVYDVTHDSELAAQYGVRSVPWFRIDALEFQGLHSTAELDYWVRHARSAAGIRQYLIEQLEAGRLDTVRRLVQTHPEWLPRLVDITADLASPMQARIGVGALFEELAGDPHLAVLIPALGELTRHNEHSVRVDACHYLGLIADPAGRPYLEACLNDPNETVREVAAEALAMIPS